MAALFECRDVTKAYGGLVAVSAVSFSVLQGEIFAVVGPNGAGKTTLFDMISGTVPVTGGSIHFEERAITGLPLHQIFRAGIARTFQTTVSFATQSVLVNALVGAAFGGGIGGGWRFSNKALEAAQAALEICGLYGKRDERADTLSVFDRKRLMLASALVGQPRLLLLDEPVGGLNRAEQDQYLDLVASLPGRGITIIMIEHVMRAVLKLASRMMVLHHGGKLAEGIPVEVLRHPDVVQSYLGTSGQTAASHA